MFTSFLSRRSVRKKEKPLVREAERLQNLPSLYPRPHTWLPGGAEPSRLGFPCCLMAVHFERKKTLPGTYAQPQLCPGSPASSHGGGLPFVQSRVYSAVLAVWHACLALCRPGRTLHEIHSTSVSPSVDPLQPRCKRIRTDRVCQCRSKLLKGNR
jgi:hypothetical protein